MITILTFRDLLRLFFIFRREFKWAFLITILVALIGLFVLPAKYESQARLLVKPGRETSTVPIELSDRPSMIVPNTLRDTTADEEKMLTAHSIAQKVAAAYLNELANAPPPEGLWKNIKRTIKHGISAVGEGIHYVFEAVGLTEAQTPAERLAGSLEKSLSATHGAGSSVIEVSFTWDDPVIAQKILNTWLDIYQQERVRPLGRNSLYTFYEGQGKKVDQQIDQYKAKITKLQNEIGAVNVQQRIETLSRRLDTLQTQYFESSSELDSLRQGTGNISRQIDGLPGEITTQREVALNPNQLDLKSKLNELQLKRANDLRTFLEDSQPIKALDESIAQLKQQIAKEPARLQRSEHHEPNALVVTLKQNLQQKRVRMTELGALVADQERQINKTKAELQRAVAAEPDINKLQHQLAVTQKNYAFYLENLERSRIDGALDKSRISNVSLMEEPTFSPGRAFPKASTILLAAVPAGILAGMFVLYLCYLLDMRIHDGGRVEKVFGVPLWSTVPDVSDMRSAKAHTQLMINFYQLYSMLPLHQVAEHGYTLALTSARPDEGTTFIAERFKQTLAERGYTVRLGGGTRATAGEIALLDCAAVLEDQKTFIQLSLADQIVLVIEAKKTSIPTVRHTIDMLKSAFRKVDGIVINRRQFEIPESVLRRFSRWLGA